VVSDLLILKCLFLKYVSCALQGPLGFSKKYSLPVNALESAIIGLLTSNKRNLLIFLNGAYIFHKIISWKKYN